LCALPFPELRFPIAFPDFSLFVRFLVDLGAFSLVPLPLPFFPIRTRPGSLSDPVTLLATPPFGKPVLFSRLGGFWTFPFFVMAFALSRGSCGRTANTCFALLGVKAGYSDGCGTRFFAPLCFLPSHFSKIRFSISHSLRSASCFPDAKPLPFPCAVPLYLICFPISRFSSRSLSPNLFGRFFSNCGLLFLRCSVGDGLWLPSRKRFDLPLVSALPCSLAVKS